tara:strand:+ start:69 stop:278 length:210 start_codon:yes stop_codon:yes gene_type:complete
MFNIDKIIESNNMKKEILNQIENHLKTNTITKSEFGINAKKHVKIEMKRFQSMDQNQLVSIVNLLKEKN